MTRETIFLEAAAALTIIAAVSPIAGYCIALDLAAAWWRGCARGRR